VDEPEVGSEAVADEVTEDASTDEDMAIEDGSEEKDVK